MIDSHSYPTGVKTTKAEFAEIHLDRDTFHGNWNYTIAPSGTISSDN